MNRFLPICFSLALLFTACKESTVVIETSAERAVHDGSALPEVVSFNEHIQPILSEYCYHCHGPDAGTRKPEKEPLRLDLEEEAFKIRDSGAPVIIKGKAAESELVRLMKSHDKNEVMPPPESHKVMKPREIALVERWIDQGATFEKHWSYEPVVRHESPKNEWSSHPIDGFVLEKLTEANLKPNEPEQPRRLHRRLSLDLTGLPPKPSETDAFVSAYGNNAEQAISDEADRMLASMASAEHFTRHWLDAARYADTHGIHIDNYRSIWPYRDWVIRSFHANMPWDQFTTEQIAGDLLPNPNLDQKIATGFLRCLATTGEGGAIAEEYEAIYATDRVDTMGSLWLGLTASCASCHDHKFDPFSTKEFYQLTAFFRNNTMSALDRNSATHPPSIFAPIPEDRETWDQLQAKISDVNKRIESRKASANADFQAWLASYRGPDGREIDSTLTLHLPLISAQGNLTGTVDGVTKEWPSEAARIDGPKGKAVVVSDKPVELGDIGNFTRPDQVTYGGFVWFEGSPTGSIIAKIDPAQGYRGWDLWLEDGKPGAHVIDSWDKSASKMLSDGKLKPRKWHHLMVVFDGTQSGHQCLSLYIDGKKTSAKIYPNTVGGNIVTTTPLTLGSRANSDSKITGKVALQDFRIYRRLLNEKEIARLANTQMIDEWIAIPADKRTKQQNDSLFEHYITVVDPASLGFIAERDKLLAEEKTIRDRGSMTLVYEEKKEAPFAHVLTRGAYSAKGEKVFPETPAMLPPMPEGAPKDRRGLAMWLNDPKNPLPARVTMNRLWYSMFGKGIVETNGDFGIMGARPTHPKLLDWLASEFVASKWNFRHMVKTIVMSKTYRQSGSISPEKLDTDPSNSLLSRGPRTRLDAEQIRDLALASSGLLSGRVGGASVKPYQPEGIWNAVAMPQSNTKDYKQDTGEALYRRSMYTFWKRTAAPPTMEILNAPTREIFCVARERTNTPLQALALMNDPQFVEAARALATLVMKESDDFDQRLDIITLRLLNRKLDGEERAAVRETHNAALNYYQGKPEEAKLALTVGEFAYDPHLPTAELAAWSLVANQLFNLDETVTR
ncbi:MAG: hypothetical protein RL346_1318 [Verrucomicrobiota bacterium]|jgi:hypothetical protein